MNTTYTSSSFPQEGRDRRFAWHLYGTLTLAICGISGCFKTATPEEPKHERPAHKPYSFSAAVERLERLERLHAEISRDLTSPRNQTADIFAEYFDVVRWLPELAADSDLSKELWDRIDTQSNVLWLYLESVSKAPPDRRQDAYQRQRGQIEKCLVNLRKLVPPVDSEEAYKPSSANASGV